MVPPTSITQIREEIESLDPWSMSYAIMAAAGSEIKRATRNPAREHASLKPRNHKMKHVREARNFMYFLFFKKTTKTRCNKPAVLTITKRNHENCYNFPYHTYNIYVYKWGSKKIWHCANTAHIICHWSSNVLKLKRYIRFDHTQTGCHLSHLIWCKHFLTKEIVIENRWTYNIQLHQSTFASVGTGITIPGNDSVI